MSSQGWNFPAPPPPPPVAPPPNPPPPPSGYAPSHTYGNRGRGGSGQYRGRGRGKGDGYRGGRGGYAPPTSNSSTYVPPPQDSRYSQVTQPEYPAHYQKNPSAGYQQSNYSSQSIYQPPVTYPQPQSTQPYYAQHSNYPPQPAPQPTYSAQYTQAPQPQDQSQYNQYPASQHQPPPPHAPQSVSYGGPSPAQQHLNSPPKDFREPQLMGPPIRMGFDMNASTQHYGHDSRHTGGRHSDHRREPRSGNRDFRSNASSNPNAYNNPSRPNFGSDNSSRGQKRRYGSAFDKEEPPVPRPQVPPSVPSFGPFLPSTLPSTLPSKPPAPAYQTLNDTKPQKKPRHRNKKLKLGLTPKGEDHESSEEDDENEEAKLASNIETTEQRFEFSYKGNTSTLSTPEEIARWIAERKKRYPTLAKAAEAKETREKVSAEAKRVREEALRLQREKKDAMREAKEKRLREEEAKRKLQDEQTNAEELALKAKVKAEKLRRKLLKEQNRVKRAEAEAERARARAEELKNTNSSKVHTDTGATTEENSANNEADRTVLLNPFADFPPQIVVQPESTETSNVEPSETPEKLKPVYLSPPEDSHPASPLSDSSLSISDSSSDPDEDQDQTSSSGSDDSLPEVASSKQTGPDSHATTEPKLKQYKWQKRNAKRLCRFFVGGNCAKGEECSFSHDPSRFPSVTQAAPGGKKEEGSSTQRKGLYRTLLEKEAAQRDEHLLRAIIHLGDRGMLDGPPSASTAVPSENEEPKEIFNSIALSQPIDAAPEIDESPAMRVEEAHADVEKSTTGVPLVDTIAKSEGGGTQEEPYTTAGRTIDTSENDRDRTAEGLSEANTTDTKIQAPSQPTTTRSKAADFMDD